MLVQHLLKSPAIDNKVYLWSIQIIITLTEGASLIYLQSGWKNFNHGGVLNTQP